jgi:hypothetical protein
LGGVIQTQHSNPANVQAGADNTITVDARDAPALLAAGATYINNRAAFANITPAPVAATAGQIVASVALANGTLSIAHQPDVPRQCALRVSPGTSPITAGLATLTYVANDGQSQVDAVSLVMPGTAVVTTNTTKAVAVMNSVVITALAGGATPLTQVNDTNSLGLPVDPGYIDFTVVRESDDNANVTIGTVASSAASVTPSTAPNGTHVYSFGYSYSAPVS